MTTERQNLGAQGENCASRYLKGKGYKIIETNYHSRHGEIDLVAMKDNKYYFAEVKTRRSFESQYGTGEEAITEFKKRKILYTIRNYFYKRRIDEATPFQVDAIIIYNVKGKTYLKHYENIVTL
jgi:putative endonuclease